MVRRARKTATDIDRANVWFWDYFIEAALMAKNIAPVLFNKEFKIFNSKFHDKDLWHSLLQIAKGSQKATNAIIQGY